MCSRNDESSIFDGQMSPMSPKSVESSIFDGKMSPKEPSGVQSDPPHLRPEHWSVVEGLWGVLEGHSQLVDPGGDGGYERSTN